MFPIPWNFPFRKKDGTVVNVEDAISGGGGSDLPDYDSSDAGKVLGVDENGELEWSDEINSEIQTLTNKLDDEIKTRAKLGAHNLIPYPYGRANGYTNNGYTYTYDSDGVVNVNGTMESGKTSSYFEFTGSGAVAIKSLKPNTTYKLTGGISNTIMLKVEITNDSTYTDTGNGVEFTTPSDFSTCKIYIHVQEATINNQKIYPMIRLASDPSTAYTPYAMTNRELTEIIDGVSNGYVCVDFNGSVEVMADGTKTEGDLCKDLADAFLAYLGTLTSDIRIEVVELSLIATALCDGLAFYTNSSTSVNIVGRGYAATSSGFSIFFAILSNTAGNNKSDYWVGSTSGNSYSDKLTTVPTSGTKRKIIFRKYKKIG